MIERLARGEEVDPALYYMRATPWFETSARALRLAQPHRSASRTGARRAAAVELDFYEVK